MGVKSVIGTILHAARSWVGAMVLVLIAGTRLWRLGWFSPGPPLVVFGFFLALSAFGFVVGLFRRLAFLGPRFQDRFGRRPVFQPTLPSGDFTTPPGQTTAPWFALSPRFNTGWTSARHRFSMSSRRLSLTAWRLEASAWILLPCRRMWPTPTS